MTRSLFFLAFATFNIVFLFGCEKNEQNFLSKRKSENQYKVPNYLSNNKKESFHSVHKNNYDNLLHTNKQSDWTLESEKPNYVSEIAKREMVFIKMAYEINECMYGHNKIRTLHQVQRLTWHEELAYSCEEYALHLATQNNGAQHSSFYDKKGRKYGENLYWYKGGDAKSCHDAIFLWYQEHEGYKYEQSNNIYASGHFIQLAWKETKYVGVGIASAHDQTWIVARYFPASNTAVEEIGKHVKEPLYAEAEIDPTDLVPLKPRPKWTQTLNVHRSGVTSCQDKDFYCDYYEQIGYCYYDSIQSQCMKTCGICKGGKKVNGEFTEWVRAEPCSTDCGTGTLKEHRYCSNPEPTNGGTECKGAITRKVKCNDNRCLNEKMDCRDLHRDCLGYMRLGYCFYPIYKPFMEINCKTSCGMCAGCRDNYINNDCVIYATDMRYCNHELYGPFMKENCQLACCEYARFFLTSGKDLLRKVIKT